MYNEKKAGKIISHQALLQPEDVLDQAVYEKVWLAIGDDKEFDVARLIKQGRVTD